MLSGAEYSATWRHTLVVGDMSVSCKAYTFCVNQGGTADKKVYSSLAENTSVKDFCFYKEKMYGASDKTMASFLIASSENNISIFLWRKIQ